MLNRMRYKAHAKARWLFSRWPVAELLNKSSRTCWANIVTWALDGGKDNLREIGQGSGPYNCAEESKTHRDRSCYCGKFTDGCLTRKGQTPGVRS